MTHEKLKVGDTVWVVPLVSQDRNQYRTVEKVGRTWAALSSVGHAIHCDAITLACKPCLGLKYYTIYRTHEEWADEIAMKKRWDEIRELTRSYRWPPSLTLADLEDIANTLGGSS